MTTIITGLLTFISLTFLMIGPKSQAPKPIPVPQGVVAYTFADGVTIRVHPSSDTAKAAAERAAFAQDVLSAAANAYQTITDLKAFSSRGYSFASPDKRYAYDPDRSIDIYIGRGSEDHRLAGSDMPHLSFRDAPCFDTVDRGGGAHEAVILLPADYADFIRDWEKMNPSPLGRRNIDIDLRGTLMHEMLHVILFYYNKNLKSGEAGTAKEADWYVEGLARYFETFAGARHDFYSLGFKQRLPDKIRFSRGGANYWMRFPDQAFTALRYENALFWRFVDERYGMEAIEKLSRMLRGARSDGFKRALEKATGTRLETILVELSDRVLTREFELKEDAEYLSHVARTRLALDASGVRLLDGHGHSRALGWICRTDWIGSWQDIRAALGEPPAAGDSTDRSDISAWATDYYEITPEASAGRLPNIAVRSQGANGPALKTRLYLVTAGGSWIRRELPAEGSRLLEGTGLAAAAVDRIYVLVTNLDPVRTADYSLVFS